MTVDFMEIPLVDKGLNTCQVYIYTTMFDFGENVESSTLFFLGFITR